jgi:excisionase family DNA binding protein
MSTRVMRKLSSNATPDTLMLDKAEVARQLVISTRHVDNLIRAGRIPRPVKLGESVRWPRREFEKWVESRCPPMISA